ncbi:MAG: hypothetical protein CVU99_06660 [Firmicutes bacterium HGW-Firmicutes-4]|jgi:hypothetical protein|nr:MAG: hypothetical protein CVU99_06660 [Firmicutes bacterium HGW-Firmicutes-4]
MRNNRVQIILIFFSVVFGLIISGNSIMAKNYSAQLNLDNLQSGIETSELQGGPTNSGILINSEQNNVVSSYFPRWKNTLFSYLINNDNGTRTIVEAGSNPITIKTYDEQQQVIDLKTIPYEFSYFGAFYSGENYNYIAFGQANREENNDKEVIRIVRYDKNFNRIDSASIKGGESFTIEPFAYSTGRMYESGNQLVLHTGRLRYTTSDGLNHQSQLTIIVDTSTMKVTNYLGRFQNNHVSHSFDQYARFDGENLVLIDHGDAYPRSVVLNRQNGNYYESVNLFSIPGTIGANCTGVSIGGFEISQDNYIVAMNTVDHTRISEYTSYEMVGLGIDQRDILLCVLGKNSLNDQSVKQITIQKYVGSDKIGSIPKLVKISDNQLIVLWQEFNLNGEIQDLKYVYVDGSGNKTTEIQTVSGSKLSECQPLIINSQLVWYANENNAVHFYSIPIMDQAKIKQLVDQIIALPLPADLKLNDRFEIEELVKNVNELNQIAKEQIDPAVIKKLNDAEVKIAELDHNAKTCIYSTHVQNIGWQSWKEDGDISGTSGEAKRLEAIRISVSNIAPEIGVEYQTHVQNIGWQEMKADGDVSGTSGKSLRLEAIRIKLTGLDSEQYDIYYQVHAENYGWLDWAKNGESAGTAGLSCRLEAIRIKVLLKGATPPGSTEQPYIEK